MRTLQVFFVALALTLAPTNSFAVPRSNHVTGHVEIDPNSDWEYITGYDPVNNQSFKDACLRSYSPSRFEVELCYSTQRNGDHRIFFYSERDSLTFPSDRVEGYQMRMRVDGHEMQMLFFATNNHFGIYPDVNNGNSRQLIDMLGSSARNLTVTLPVQGRGNMTFSFRGLNLLNSQRLFP